MDSDGAQKYVCPSMVVSRPGWRSALTIEKERKLGSQKWIDAHYDPMAKLNTFTQCIATADIFADGDNKLVVADIGSSGAKMKLKVYKGTGLLTECALIDLPTAITAFYMDTTEPRTPAIAVGSTCNLYIYKNMRPFYKFNLPSLEVDQLEIDGSVKPDVMVEALQGLAQSNLQLSNTSKTLLRIKPEDRGDFITAYAQLPLKRQTVITCMATMKRSSAEDDAVSCIVLGTEMNALFIVDAEAFTVLTSIKLPSVPSHLCISGMYDVDYRIIVSCRNEKLYSIRKNESAKFIVDVKSQLVGLIRPKNIVVGCMDDYLHSFSTKGKKLWSHKMPSNVTTLAEMELPRKGFSMSVAALGNGEVRIYREKYLVDTIRCPDPITSMTFGRYGREDSTLVMTSEGGCLYVKMLKRTAEFDDMRDQAPGPPMEQFKKLDVPKKTRLFVDQTVRERENAIAMHRSFQQDLARIRLKTARNYAESLTTGMTPISTDPTEPIKLNAAVTGLGPRFRIAISIQNCSAGKPSANLFVTFTYNRTIYELEHSVIAVPFLVPGVSYAMSTYAQCICDEGGSDNIKVLLCRDSSHSPILTAVISMPLAEPLEG